MLSIAPVLGLTPFRSPRRDVEPGPPGLSSPQAAADTEDSGAAVGRSHREK